MPRPSHLSSDNILRFLQVRRDPATTDQIAAGLHMRRADRHALNKMLSTLKKRRAIEELPGGRYRLPGRRQERDRHGQTTEQEEVRHSGAPAGPTAPAHQRPAAANRSTGGGSREEI